MDTDDQAAALRALDSMIERALPHVQSALAKAREGGAGLPPALVVVDLQSPLLAHPQGGAFASWPRYEGRYAIAPASAAEADNVVRLLAHLSGHPARPVVLDLADILGRGHSALVTLAESWYAVVPMGFARPAYGQA